MTDVYIIIGVVLLNAILGVVQESKAESAIEALRQMSGATCKVIRDGKQKVIPCTELVPGDIVVLEAGDAVPADGRLVEAVSLKVEESALTGESVPVNKIIDVLRLKDESRKPTTSTGRNEGGKKPQDRYVNLSRSLSVTVQTWLSPVRPPSMGVEKWL